MSGKQRDLSLDFIRALAALMVVTVHFFLNAGFYGENVAGKGMFLAGTARMGLMTCVPLFLLLTGYLCRNKILSARYYLGYLRIFATYLLCGLVCLVFRLWRGEAVGLLSAARQLLNFTAAPYGWYVEMYTGLFLLIPFLNMMWQGASSQKNRGILVGTLLALTALPALVNVNTDIIQNWWVGMYPLTYYFLGAYLGEYQPRVDWRWALPALAVSVLAGGGAFYSLSGGGPYRWNALCDWYGPTVILSAVLLFLLLRQVPVHKAPGWVRWLVGKGAELSLGIYLISWCFDQVFYPYFMTKMPPWPRRLLWLPAVLAVYLGAALAAQCVEWLRRGLTALVNKLIPQAGLK